MRHFKACPAVTLRTLQMALATLVLTSCSTSAPTGGDNSNNDRLAGSGGTVQITPSSASPGDAITLTGAIPGGSNVHVCDAPLDDLVFNAGSDDDPTWVLADNSDTAQTYRAARGSLASELTPGASCEVVILQSGDPVIGLDLPTFTLNPSVPAGIAHITVTNGFKQSTLSFDAPMGHGLDISAYEVQMQPGGDWTRLTATDLPLTVENLENGRAYQARVRAVNVLGTGPASEPVHLAPYGPTVAAGQIHTLATTTAGTLYGWGGQYYGVLGNGVNINSETVQPSTYSAGTEEDIPVFTKIAAGGTMAFGLDEHGQSWAWGNSNQGRLGVPTGTDTTKPVQMAFDGLTEEATIVDLAAGDAHGLALDSEGNVWGWGLTTFYQLAQSGLSVDEPTQISVTGLRDGVTITSIAAASNTSFALDSEGHLWAWGHPGTNLFAGQSTPILQTPTRLNVTDQTGLLHTVVGGGDHVMAIDRDGHLWTWGNSADNRLGHTPSGSGSTPQQAAFGDGAALILGAPEGRDVVKVAAGNAHSVALDSDGGVWTVGKNDTGQLGKPTAPGVFTQVDLQSAGLGLQGTPVDVAAGTQHSVAIDAAGNAVTWGGNVSGQLGTDTAFGTSTHQPQNVQSPF